LLAASHRSANQARGHSEAAVRTLLHQELLEDLTWAEQTLRGRAVDVEELTSAREVWDWHYRFDPDDALKSAATKLESLYAVNDLAAEFEPLFDRLDWRERAPRAEEKGAQLAASSDARDIDAFLDRAVRFLGNERDLYQLLTIAIALGNHSQEHRAVQAFVKASLSTKIVSGKTDFAAVAAATWIASLRKAGNLSEAAGLVVELVSVCGSDEQRVHFLQRLYGGSPPPREGGRMSEAEHQYLRSLGPLFAKNDRTAAFIQATAWTFDYDWPRLRLLLEESLDRLNEETITPGVDALVESIFWAVEANPSSGPPGLSRWLLDQVIRMPDLDGGSDMMHWHLEQILKRVGLAPIEWLPLALTRRRRMEESGSDVRAVGGHTRLSAYVPHLDAESATKPDVRAAIRQLLDLVPDQGTVGYHLADIVRDVDPEGLLVPEEAAHRAAAMVETTDVLRIARIGGAYPVGGHAWRTVATPIMKRAMSASDRERRSLFNALTDHGVRSFSGAPGEVPQMYLAAVEAARKQLAAETEAELRPFWEWNLAVAEAELREETERAKEERGE
jgi:hypothetical protein